MEAHPRLEREEREPDVETAGRLVAAREELDRAIGRTIVGQQGVRELMLVALLARGHALLIGVPGLAKTLLVQTLARALDCRFGRIQFTPDLMPSDITGTEVIDEDPETGRRRLRFLPGPVFAQVLRKVCSESGPSLARKILGRGRLLRSASNPTATFSLPVELLRSALVPKAGFHEPVLTSSALRPKAATS